MPIGYGSKSQLPKLSPNQIAQFAIKEPEEEKRPSLSWLSWLLTAAEIGLSFIPGVGAIGGLALGLANAGAQTGIEYAESGKVSVIGTVLNFGGALIPGAIGIVRQGRGYIKAGQELVKQGESVMKEAWQKMTSSSRMGGKDMFDEVAKVKMRYSEGRRMVLSGKKSGFFTNPQKLLKKEIEFTEHFSKSYRQNMPKYEYNEVNGERIRQVFDPTKNMKESLEKVREVNSKILRSNKVFSRSGGESTKGAARFKLDKDLSKITGLFLKEIKILRGLIDVSTGAIRNYKAWYRILRKAYERTENPFLELVVAGARKQKFIKLLTRTETTSAKISRIASQTMSKTTKYGSMLLSPSSLAGEIISKTVARLTPKIEQLGERFAAKITSFVKKGAKGLKELEDEFVKTGGVKVNSEWIMGIKLLTTDPAMNVVLFQFNPATTKNKESIVANMSAIQ